jgi:hypothetical protein
VRRSRVRRVEVPAQIAATFARSTANYAVAFELTEPGVERWTPLHWARAVFEDAPAALRWCIVFGWRHVLGLRLAPRPAAGHVLGWAISGGDLVEGSVALTAQSGFLQASNIVAVEATTVTWVTLVHYSGAAARPLWALARPIHRRTIPYLLRRAGDALAREAGSDQHAA